MPFLRPLAHFRRNALKRSFATAVGDTVPQTVIEKVVQKYAVGLPEGKFVKAGDYVMIRPQHVMTHDNTGPVISKCVYNCLGFDIATNLQ
jgi:homoaconitate hydratase